MSPEATKPMPASGQSIQFLANRWRGGWELETQCESLDNVEKYYMWTVEYTSLQSPATELCIIIRDVKREPENR